MATTRREFLTTAATVAAAAAVTRTAGAFVPNSISSASSSAATLTVDSARKGPVISKHIYGHFAEHLGRCIYDGIWVKPESKIPNTNGYRNEVVAALKALAIPNLRWPGGCFADDYRWRDGIGPRETRPRTINIHWGNTVEDNSFGTHEFLDLCELLGTDPYIAINVGSGTPQEMRDWIEYMTFAGDSSLANERRKNGRDKPWKVPFIGIGNETWGCGGDMTPEYYTDLYNRFAVFARQHSDNALTRVASGVNAEDYRWAEVVLDKGRGVQGVSWHYYTVYPNWQHKGDALSADPADWLGYMVQATKLERILHRADEIFDKRDPDNRIGIYFDEWGTWHATQPGDSALYQQNTMRDVLVASLSLDIFHKHARRVRMANIAQVVNVLQAVILTEPGGQNRMLLTPTYHLMEMYKVFMGATSVPVDVKSETIAVKDRELPSVSSSASIDASGVLHVAVSNLSHAQSAQVSLNLKGSGAKTATGRLLAGDALNAHNTFDEPDKVKPVALDDLKLDGQTLKINLPPASVAVIAVK